MQLSIEVGSEPIAGSITVNAGAQRQFSGWIELVAAIEEARQPGASFGGESLRVISGAGGGQA